MRGLGASAPPPLPAGSSNAAPFVPRSFGAPPPKAAFEAPREAPPVVVVPRVAPTVVPGGSFGDRIGSFDDHRGGYDGGRGGYDGGRGGYDGGRRWWL